MKVEPVEDREFPVEKEAVGSIDFDEDMETQVFTPYQGKIIALFAAVGDDVKKGQTLFTIDSPDLLQAESTLIAAAGVLELTTRNLARLRELYKTLAVSQRDLDQATSDQQTAEGNLRAARDAVRIFGKTDADIERIIADRSADPTLVVPSPITGRITARSAAPGLFVQPANPPPPYIVTDIDTMWMLANVAENDSPAFRVGQEVKVRLGAFPGRVFDGKITTIGASVDPNTRRVLVRSEIKDPQHELRSGMFANFVIEVGAAGPFPGGSGRRRRAGRRRHDDGVGHGRPPPVHQADGQDRRAARRLPADSRRRAGRRTGRHRRRAVPEQYACHGVGLKADRSAKHMTLGLRGHLCSRACCNSD